jgi:hypothetical protein
MKQEALDRLRELIDSSPRCKCGGNCELLQNLAEQVLDIQENEVGFQAQCPTCNQPLLFNRESIHDRYSCKQEVVPVPSQHRLNRNTQRTESDLNSMARIRLVWYWKRYLRKGRYRCRRYLLFLPVAIGDRVDRSVEYSVSLFGPAIVLLPKGAEFLLSRLEKTEILQRQNPVGKGRSLTDLSPENLKPDSL